MEFPPIRLSPAEKQSFVEYMIEVRNFSESTIQSVLDYLTVTVANTKTSRRKARYARRVYQDYLLSNGGQANESAGYD